MYEERKKRINWFRLFLVTIIVALLILLALKIISLITYNGKPEKYYGNELNRLNDTAVKYYKKDNIPNEIGESSIIYLKDFKDNNIEYELKVRKNDTCDLDSSYIRATRLESEYQVKSYIKCDNFEDTINTYVSLDESKEETTTRVEKPETTTKEMSTPKEEETTTKVVITEKVEPTTKKTTKKTTTNKVNTTKTVQNKITIGFNTNGGNQIKSIEVNKGSKVNLPTPIRNGYTFIGWYKNYQQYTNNTIFNDNIILVAKWVKD